MKEFLKLTLIALPFAALYNILEAYLNGSWIAAAIVIFLMAAARAGLYFYRKSKGIEDNWPDD